jgi:hypothetical protein
LSDPAGFRRCPTRRLKAPLNLDLFRTGARKSFPQGFDKAAPCGIGQSRAPQKSFFRAAGKPHGLQFGFDQTEAPQPEWR